VEASPITAEFESRQIRSGQARYRAHVLTFRMVRRIVEN
jgi:hypothetical protein